MGDKKKISVYMDEDVHVKLKKIQQQGDLKSISAAIRKVLNEYGVTVVEDTK